MRILAGSKKGAKLKGPKTKDIRPTTSIVKEYIFGFLGEFIRDKRVLDLFSGTGSLGIEAISRGAASVSFVDISKHSINILRDNLKKTGFESRAKIFKTDIFTFISKSYKDSTLFDSGSQSNLISEDLFKKLNCETIPHHKPYPLGWIVNNENL